jgi:hypothetical protein
MVNKVVRGVVLIAFLSCWLGAGTAWPRDLDRKALQPGMTLPEVVQAFGQPDSMEWMDVQGQAVLFVFFESEDRSVLSVFPMWRDTIKVQDGRSLLPLGFVTEKLAGWGKKFYIQMNSSK